MTKSFDIIIIAQRRLADAFATARMLRRMFPDEARRAFADDYTDQARRWMRVVVALRHGNARA